jgi:hypothetical protein
MQAQKCAVDVAVHIGGGGHSASCRAFLWPALSHPHKCQPLETTAAFAVAPQAHAAALAYVIVHAHSAHFTRSLHDVTRQSHFEVLARVQSQV